jgi:hypothetical protein
VSQAFGYDGLGRLTWCLDNNGEADQPPVLVRRNQDGLGKLISERVSFSRAPGRARARGVVHDEELSYLYDQSNSDFILETDHAVAGCRRTFGPDGLTALDVPAPGGWDRFLTRTLQGPGRVLASLVPIGRNDLTLQLLQGPAFLLRTTSAKS